MRVCQSAAFNLGGNAAIGARGADWPRREPVRQFTQRARVKTFLKTRTETNSPTSSVAFRFGLQDASPDGGSVMSEPNRALRRFSKRTFIEPCDLNDFR